MQIEGKYKLSAPPERVYAALLDPKVLAACIPGCEKLEPAGPDKYAATLTMGVAAIKGTYQGTVVIQEKTPPSSYVLEMEGKGGPGYVKGRGTLSIAAVNGGSEVAFAGDAQVGGLIARVGQRVIGGVAKHVINQFFERLEKTVKQA